MLFDRAAALFGTKAAAAERHRATMRRCIVEIRLCAPLSRSHVVFDEGRRARAKAQEQRGGSATKKTEVPTTPKTAQYRPKQRADSLP